MILCLSQYVDTLYDTVFLVKPYPVIKVVVELWPPTIDVKGFEML